MADVQITIGADLSQMIKSLQDGGTLTKKEAAAMGRSLKGAFNGAEKEAAKARKAMDKASKSVDVNAKSWEAAKEAAEGYGGPVGAAAGMLDKFGKSFKAATAALGPAGAALIAGGLAATGLGVAVVGATAAFIASAAAAEEWAKELEELGVAVDEDAVANVERFNDSIKALEVIGKRVFIELVGDMAGEVNGFAKGTVMAALAAEDLVQAVGGGTAIFKGLALLLAGPTAVGLVEATFAMADLAMETDAAKAATKSYSEEADTIIGKVEKVAEVEDKATGAVKRNTEAIKERNRFAVKFIQDVQRMSISADAEAARRESDAAARQIETQRRVDDEIKQINEDQIRYSKEKTAKVIADTGAVASASADLLGAMSALFGAQEAALQRDVEKTQAAISKAREKGDKEEVKRLKKQAAFEKTLVLKAFRRGKAMSISEAAINGAVAFTAALTIPPPVGVIAAAASAVATTAQIAVIAGQQPPTFAGGGMVGDKTQGDHVAISASNSEAVLTAGGVDAAGGRRAIEDLNNRNTRPQVIQLVMPGGMMAEAILNDSDVQRAILRVTGNTSLRGRF